MPNRAKDLRSAVSRSSAAGKSRYSFIDLNVQMFAPQFGFGVSRMRLFTPACRSQGFCREWRPVDAGHDLARPGNADSQAVRPHAGGGPHRRGRSGVAGWARRRCRLAPFPSLRRARWSNTRATPNRIVTIRRRPTTHTTMTKPVMSYQDIPRGKHGGRTPPSRSAHLTLSLLGGFGEMASETLAKEKRA
jgi:hypothetical protein